MSKTVVGMALGAVLALSWAALGFWAFVLVLFAMAVGAGVGRIMDGRLDVRTLTDAFRGKRSSS
ncbi:hypothetical protein GCM10022288_20980 [Gryllotalpicola kribbensis]|uniref:DUF2273 domain-containing protein n=1 Tax=Gryllotalpicola kribbensis TaxID=993084 RepID=A0ABP8AV97_9MICO